MGSYILFIIVLTTYILTCVGKRVHLKGSYKFLPYEDLTDKIFNEKRFEIGTAHQLTIELFAISTPEILIRNLNNSTSIQYLYLNDITFDSIPENGRKIYLPWIYEYKIFVRNVELKEDEKFFEVLRRFLLVQKKKDNYYGATVQLGTKIYVEYNYLYSNCVSRYLPPLPLNEFNCKKLDISKQSIDVRTISQGLKELELFDVDIYETTDNINGSQKNQLTQLHDILTYLPELTHLRIIYSSVPNYPIIFDLSYLLRWFSWVDLSYAKIVSTKSFEKEHEISIRAFGCEHCEFEITKYSNLIISSWYMQLGNTNYKTPDGFQRFIASTRNVLDLTVTGNNLNFDWLHGTVDSLVYLRLANINYQQPKLSLVFPNVGVLTLVNIRVAELESSLSHSFPNLRNFWTTDTNPDLLNILKDNKKLEKINVCFPEMGLTGTRTTLEPRDFNIGVYEHKDNSWEIKEGYGSSSRGIPYRVQLYIQFYILAIFIISSIGLVGNALIIIVYTRQQPRNSTSHIILSLALHDSLLLILTQISLAYFQIKLIMDEGPVSDKKWDEKTVGSLKNLFLNHRGVKVLWYNLEITDNYLEWLFNTQSKWIYPLSKAAYFGSVYTTVLLTVERYIAICFPFRVKDYFNSKSVRIYFIIFGILSICLVAIKGFESFYSNELFQQVYKTCGITYFWERSSSSKNPLNHRLYRLLFQGIFWNAMMYFIPIPLLLVLNYLIWREIRRSATFRSETTTPSSPNSQATLQITSMLVGVSLVFVVCNSISGAIVWYRVQKGADHLADVEIYSCLPLVINSSVNFVLYSLLGKKFREEFFKNWVQCWGRTKKLCDRVVVRLQRHQAQHQHRAASAGTENPEFVLQRL